MVFPQVFVIIWRQYNCHPNMRMTSGVWTLAPSVWGRQLCVLQCATDVEEDGGMVPHPSFSKLVIPVELVWLYVTSRKIRERLTHICCAFFGCLLLTTVDIKDTSWFDFRRKNGARVSALELYLSHQIINTIDFIVFETSPLIRLIYSRVSSAVHFVQLLRVLELNVVQAQQRSGMRWSGDALWHPSHFLCRRVMSQLWPALSAGGPCKHLLSLSVTRTFVLCCSGANGIRSELCTSIRQTAWTVQYSSRLLKVLCNHHLH